MNYSLIALVAMAAVCAAAPAPQAVVAAPVYAAPAVVTATSSQYIARNYNGLVAPAVVADLPYTYSAPYAVAPAVEPVYYI